MSRLLPIPVSLLLLLLVSGTSRADVIRLRTGEAVKGRPIQERSDEKQITVEDYLTGGLRRFAWEALDPEDSRRIKVRWGYENTEETIIEGSRVTIKLTGGDTEDYLGLVERTAPDRIFLRRAGQLLEVPLSQIDSQEPEDVDARQVWTPDQLYERLVTKMKDEEHVDFDNLTSKNHWRLAQYAEWAGALEQARDHYQACADDADYLKRDVARQRLERIEGLLRSAAALDTLREAGMKLQLNRFGDAREILDGFREKHPEASEAVLEQLDQKRSEYEQERTTYFRKLARRRFVKIVKDLIEDKVREKVQGEDIQITDVQSWTRKQLPEAAFKLLAERMQRYDPEVTADEAQDFWKGRMEGRTKPRWDRVSYGSGTFIVDPPKLKPPKRRRGAPRGGGNRGGAAPPIQIPKPPTRDQWWERADPRDRANWALAFFVEQSPELFVLGEREYRPCRKCHGVGLLEKTYQTGDVLTYLCDVCGGAQRDVIVKYR